MGHEKTRGLTPFEISLFLALDQNLHIDALFQELEESDGGWVLKAIEKRFKAYKIDVDKRVLISILEIGDGIVGRCAKYVDDVASWANEFHHAKIEWDMFYKEIYPFGIPIL